jgi:hypothetical protein
MQNAVRHVLRKRSIPRRVWNWVWGMLGAAAILTGLWTFYVQFVAAPKPVRMVGDLNIAVAEFSAADQRGRPARSAIADDLAKTMADELRRHLAALNQGRIVIQVQPPSQFGRINGANPRERAAEAQRLAQAIHAHVVVYGTLIPRQPS